MIARLGPPLLLTLLLAATALATTVAFATVRDRERDARVDRTQADAGAIERRMQAYTEVLRGGAALFETGDDIGPVAFRRYFDRQDVARRYPGVTAIFHASLLRGGDLRAFERRQLRALTESGLPYPKTFAAHPRPGAATQRMLVVDLLQNPIPNTVTLGRDLLADRDRRRPARLALQTGMPAASAPLRLLGPLGDRGVPSLGLVLVVPTRHPATNEATGALYASFRVDRLLRGVLGRQPARARTELFDLGPSATTRTTTIGRRAVAFDLAPGRADAAQRAGDDTHVETFAVAGRLWAVSSSGAGEVLSVGERLLPWFVLVAGITVSLLAAGLLRTLSTAQDRAQRLARRMTRELHESEAELQRSNAELEHFAYLASHDLQEPLRTITAYAGLLETRAGAQLDDKARQWLGFVSDGAGRMSQLIADLLEYSRAGRAPGDAEPTSMAKAWDDVVADLDQAIRDAGAVLSRDEDLPTVPGRPRELARLLQNLAINGLRYRGERPVRVHLSARRVGPCWELRVIDNGIGIDPRFRERVFGLFQRLHTADEYPGTGMGLAIVKKTVESYGGTVHLEDTPGGGATVVLTLPAGDDA